LGFRSRIDPADADVLAGGASQVELDPGTVAAEEEASGGGLVGEERIRRLRDPNEGGMVAPRSWRTRQWRPCGRKTGVLEGARKIGL
jgi:hypothetical protein